MRGPYFAHTCKQVLMGHYADKNPLNLARLASSSAELAVLKETCVACPRQVRHVNDIIICRRWSG